VFDRLSNLVATTAGDAATPFDTIGGIIEAIPDIVNYGEETAVMIVYSDTIRYFVLGWDYEESTELWNSVLQSEFPELELIAD
jgi:hypothetical protein